MTARRVSPTSRVSSRRALVRLRLSVNFYLVAVFFVIFDLEVAFLFAWALCVRQAGWTGYLDSLIFIGILMAALAYLWREGALDRSTGQR